jgi:Virulence-associated protein E
MSTHRQTENIEIVSNKPSANLITKGSEFASDKRDLDSKQGNNCLDTSSKAITSFLSHDTELAAYFLQMTHDSRHRYLVAIHPEKSGGPVAQRILRKDELHAWLTKHEGWNIYFTVNEPASDIEGGNKCRKTDIQTARFLHVDVDPRAGEDIVLERKRILSLLTDDLPDGVPAPTCVIDSGGGYQALWLLREPQAIAGDSYSMSSVEDRSRWLERRLGADNCHNIDRVLRLPGTVNWPNSQKRAKGREPAMARLVFWKPEHSYELSDFGATPKVLVSRHQHEVRVTVNDTINRLSSVNDLPRAVPDRIKVIIVQGHHPDEGTKPNDNSRSAWLFDAVCGMVRAGCDDDTIFGVITDPGFGVSESVVDKGSNSKAYAIRQIEKARNVVESEHSNDGRSERPNWATVRINKSTGELIVVPDFENTRIAILAIGIVAQHDVFHDRKLLGGHAIGRYAGELSDDACLYLRHLVFKTYGWQPYKQDILDAALLLCNSNPIDPVVEYLSELVWDGKPRLDTFAATHLAATDNALNRAIGRKVLIAAVRRARQPGCKFDYVPVFEGKQGCGKSSAVRILAGDDNFSDKGLLHLEDRAQQEAVKGVWLYELAELAGLGKKDVNRIKAFVSQQDDRGRQAYARFATNEKRRCVFIGTTNDAEYLVDTTGNRRFLPMAVGQIDLAALKRDRDQLWAEAARAEAEGELLEVPSDLWSELGSRQRERMQGGDWTDILSTLYGERVGDEYRISSEECYRALGIEPQERQNYTKGEGLKRAMVSLGWTKRAKIRFGKRTLKGFSRSIAEHDSAYGIYGPKVGDIDCF